MSTSTPIGKILLLREPPDDPVDRYEAAFRASGYDSVSVPVLETHYTNIANLKNMIRLGPGPQSISGVLITSKRSCDAWRQALQELQESASSDVASWASVPFYVVGNSSAMALQNVLSTYSHIGIGMPEIRGQTTGSAANLAPLILSEFRGKPPVKLLYLTGDKNTDTLSRLLAEGGISLQSLQVYETHGSTSFPDALSAAISSPPTNNLWWIVFFAPSAAAFVMPTLRNFFNFDEAFNDITSSTSQKAKVAAIGPTTHNFLHDELRLQVHAMANKPTPDDIVSAINLYDKAH